MAVGDAIPGFLTPVLTKLSYQSHKLLFSYASEVRDKKKKENAEKKVSLKRVSNSQPQSIKCDNKAVSFDNKIPITSEKL